MTHGELVPTQEVGAVEPAGYNLPADPDAPTWANLPSVPQVYADLFYPRDIDRRTNPYSDPSRVVEIITAVLSDIATVGDEDGLYTKAPVPISANLSVIQDVLNELPSTPVAFAGDGLPLFRLQAYWDRFRDGSIQAFREVNGLGRSNMVPLDLSLPEGLGNSGFDPLNSAVALRSKVSQKNILTTLASNISNSEIIIDGNVQPEATIGYGAHHSRFTITGKTFRSHLSFYGTNDVVIDFGNAVLESRIGRIGGKSYVSKSNKEDSGKLTIIGDSMSVKSTGWNIQYIDSL